MKHLSTNGVIMSEIAMNGNDQQVFKQALDYAIGWSKQHQLEIGAAEMALGAAAITWGIHHGAITMGKDLVDAALSHGEVAKDLGGLFGGCLGATAGIVLGSIGIAALGGGVAVPAALLAGAGSVILGACGYTAADLAHRFLNPPVDIGTFIGSASVLAVGIALLIDGARRIIKDARVLAAVSKVKDGIIYLVELSGLKQVVKDILSKPETSGDAMGRIATAGAVAAGTGAVGATVAAGTVTVLGSHAIGAAALSLGLVSAPLWPVIVCGAAGMGVGYAAWAVGRRMWLSRDRNAGNHVTV
jgi:hypothetical protein